MGRCSPGTQLVAMATLLLRGVRCSFSENYKNSSSSVHRSSIIFRLFSALSWLSFGLHSITLTQQKLESGSDDSGCVCRTCVDAKLDFNFLHN